MRFVLLLLATTLDSPWLVLTSV